MMTQGEVVRFWSKVRKTDTCWLWGGSCDAKGYGHFYLKNIPRRSHRVSYEMAYGSIPEGLHVCHRCDVPGCVRPDHLFLGTAQENNDDKEAKGHQVSGERHGCAKLTRVEVADIAFRYRRGGETQRALAAAYGVSQRQIGRIVNGRSWN